MQSDMKRPADEGPKAQHTVPESYLLAWGDPASKNPRDPYVWSFPKNRIKGAPKPPAVIFKQSNFYTIQMPDGSRDLRLEHGLATLEERFCAIRDKKLAEGIALDPEERAWLCAFVAAMKCRTPGLMEHHSKQWQAIVDYMHELKAWAASATPEQRAAAASISVSTSKDGASGTLEDAERLAANPVEHLLGPMIATQLPILAGMRLAIIRTADSVGFITSDDPCTWFDPDGYKLPEFYRSPGLAYETIEVAMPVSPSQLALLSWRGPEGFVDVPIGAVNELNRRTRAHAHEYFVANSSVSNPVWFDLGKEPEDSWEKSEGPTPTEEEE